MPGDYFDIPCPPELEDEAWMIEAGGEMPEVSLAESLGHLGRVAPQGLRCLRAVAARRYLVIIRRDLEPDNRGATHFRGLERALANLKRLEGFLAGLGWEMPPALRQDMGRGLLRYLRAEAAELAAGRGYVTCRESEVRELAARLGKDPRQAAGLVAAGQGLPYLDFLGLAALKRIAHVAGRLRRQQSSDAVNLEVLGPDDRVKAAATLELTGPAGPDPEARERAELVWRLARAGRSGA